MQKIREQLNVDINSDTDSSDHIVHIYEVQKAAQKLKAEKARW